MKYIQANTPPEELIKWTAAQRVAGVNLHFDTFGTVEINGQVRDVKTAILESRIKDQGFICPYTLLRIETENTSADGTVTPATAHLEHLVPRTVSDHAAPPRPEETVDYGNMVACFPKNGGDKSYGFGAPMRDDVLLVVSPRDPACERVISYHQNGTVNPSQASSPQEQDPIWIQLNTTLGLNTDKLKRFRRGAFLKAGVSLESDPNSLDTPEKAEKLAQEIVRFRRGEKLTPHCVAIAHAALAHAAKLRKLRAQRAQARRHAH
jgi:hypothetical protein